MIEFREDQTEIFIGKNKLTQSSYDGCLDMHLVYLMDERSGYEGKFVRVITFENKYSFEVIREIKSDNFEDEIDGIMYFESGGYLYDKKLFKSGTLQK